MRILIIKPSALGDVIQALPVLNGLRDHWPDAEIDWVINDQLLPVLEGHPSINRLIPYPRKRWTVPWRLPEMQAWARQLHARRYDLTLDLQGLLRSGLMTWAAASPRRIGLASAREGARFAYNEVVRDTARLAAQRYLQCLEYLSIPGQPYDFRLNPQTPLPAPINDGRPYVVLHPYCQWRTKLWPWRNYPDLIAALPEIRFVVVGIGPWFPLLNQSDRVVDLRNRLSLPELISILASAKAVVSPDSGPAHLAAALDRPTLVLFGPTDPERTKPIGRHVTVLNHALSCSPCLKRRCPQDEPVQCMAGIRFEAVGSYLAKLS